MLHNAQQLQFFMSTDSPCPYLDGKQERKLFTSLATDDAERTQNALSQQGFRRSQSILYRPVCQDCAGCLSARIPVNDFLLSKNQRRIVNKNAKLVSETRQAKATEEQFEVFERYVKSRHMDGGMSDMNLYDYAAMIDETNVPTRVVEYRAIVNGRPEKLVGMCLTDILDDGLSMVYSFFDPDYSSASIGTFMILDHIRLCQKNQLPYLYLGYWVKNSRNMDYKARFRPLELYVNGLWKRFHDLEEVNAEVPNSQKVLFNALRTLSSLREGDAG